MTKLPPIIQLFRPLLPSDEQQSPDHCPASSGFSAAYKPKIPLLKKGTNHVRDQAMLSLSFSTPCQGLIHFGLSFLREFFEGSSIPLRGFFDGASIIVRYGFDNSSTRLRLSLHPSSRHVRPIFDGRRTWVGLGWEMGRTRSLPVPRPGAFFLQPEPRPML